MVSFHLFWMCHECYLFTSCHSPAFAGTSSSVSEFSTYTTGTFLVLLGLFSANKCKTNNLRTKCDDYLTVFWFSFTCVYHSMRGRQHSSLPLLFFPLRPPFLHLPPQKQPPWWASGCCCLSGFGLAAETPAWSQSLKNIRSPPVKSVFKLLYVQHPNYSVAVGVCRAGGKEWCCRCKWAILIWFMTPTVDTTRLSTPVVTEMQ